MAGEGRDVIHTAFLRASRDGIALSSEAEWRHFMGQLKASAVCSSSREQQVLEEAWATCDTASTSRRLTYPAFRNHVVSAFLTRDARTEEARRKVRAVRAASAQLQAMTGMDGAPMVKCRELLERCRDADRHLLFGEAVLSKSLRSAEQALEAERLRSLVQAPLGRDALGLLAPPDPCAWQLEHCVDVEKTSAPWRVSAHDHVRYPKGGGEVQDVFGLAACCGADCTVRVAKVLCADGATRDAFVVVVAPSEPGPRQGASMSPSGSRLSQITEVSRTTPPLSSRETVEERW